MNGDVGIMKLLRAVCLVLWAVIIFLPAVFLFAQAFAADAVPETYHIFASLVRSFGLAAIISARLNFIFLRGIAAISIAQP